jgi:DNA-binding HxlR family transcriptional regulator
MAIAIQLRSRFAASDGLDLVQRWMSAAAGKWALPILDRLAQDSCRYNRLLEGDGLIACERVGTYGRRYRLTECGRQVRERLSHLRELAGAMAPTSCG